MHPFLRGNSSCTLGRPFCNRIVGHQCCFACRCQKAISFHVLFGPHMKWTNHAIWMRHHFTLPTLLCMKRRLCWSWIVPALVDTVGDCHSDKSAPNPCQVVTPASTCRQPSRIHRLLRTLQQCSKFILIYTSKFYVKAKDPHLTHCLFTKWHIALIKTALYYLFATQPLSKPDKIIMHVKMCP